MKKIIIFIKKRFSSIGIFDILIYGILLVILSFLFIIFLRKKEYITITIKVTNDNVLYSHRMSPAWFAQIFKKGMVEKDYLGRIVIEVIDIRVYDYYDFQNTWDQGREAKQAMYVTVKVKAVYNSRSQQYSFRGKPLLIGESIKIQPGTVSATGIITYIEGIEDPRIKKYIVIEAKVEDTNPKYLDTSGVKPYIAEALQVGDSIKDSQRNLLIEIIEKNVKQAERTTVDNYGNLYVKQDPSKYDISLKLKVNSYLINGDYYVFDDIKIETGAQIPLHFPRISIFPVVTRFINVDINDSK